MVDGAAFRILSCYIGANTLSFTELCRQANYPTDLGGYYIRRLVNAKCIVKTSRGQYEITPHGKQLLIRLEHQQGRSVMASPRVCVMAIVRQGDKFVVMRRKRQPFIGFAEWPATTLLPGENVTDGTKRLLDDRLSVSGNLTLLGFFRRIDTYNDTIFDDKLFAVHLCELDKDAPIASQSPTGDNMLLTLEELQAIDKPARALHDIYAFSQAPANYQERRYALSLQDIVSEDE